MGKRFLTAWEVKDVLGETEMVYESELMEFIPFSKPKLKLYDHAEPSFINLEMKVWSLSRIDRIIKVCRDTK